MSSSSSSLPSSWGVTWCTSATQLSVAEFLASDLVELVQRRSLIRPFLTADSNNNAGGSYGAVGAQGSPPIVTLQADGPTVSTVGWGLLQLQCMHNILEDLPQRVHHQTARAEEDGGGGGGGRRKRIAKLLLTDGLHSVVAMERGGLQGCEALDTICFGAKIRVTSPTLPMTSSGILLLEPSSFFVVGGSVRSLQLYWDGMMKALHRQLCGGPPEMVPAASSGGSPGDTDAAVTATAVSASVPPPPQASMHPAGLHQSTHVDAAHVHHVATPIFPPPKRNRSDDFDNKHHPSSHDAHQQHQPTPSKVLVVDGAIAEVRGNLNVVRGEFVLPVLILVTNVVEGAPSDVGGGELEVDLGHRWMRVLLGMGCEEFMDISEGADAGNPSAQAQLDEVVERVSSFLENYGSGRLRLALRTVAAAATDGAAVPQWIVTAQERH